jgi:nucleotide-binding universal stress UspA family protein
MTTKIKNILYATSLADPSIHVLRSAIDTARKHEARIHILHVLERLTPSAEAALSVALPNFREIRRKNMDEMAGRIEHGVSAFKNRELQNSPEALTPFGSIIVVEGDTAEEILKAADRLNCELIVLGSHRKGFLFHALLGSVSGTVLRHTLKPVYVIPVSETNGEGSLDAVQEQPQTRWQREAAGNVV